ncbi:hypothetical protein NKJ93_32275 [Mesorhizobium sp. M0028]|uniref:hypothetical protein n=1 Tax=Mesorhizobium sp. M0028 TaxID=2956849 RepID=UPI00333BDBAD
MEVIVSSLLASFLIVLEKLVVAQGRRRHNAAEADAGAKRGGAQIGEDVRGTGRVMTADGLLRKQSSADRSPVLGTVGNSVREAMMMERRESSHGY